MSFQLEKLRGHWRNTADDCMRIIESEVTKPEAEPNAQSKGSHPMSTLLLVMPQQSPLSYKSVIDTFSASPFYLAVYDWESKS
ncbi:hypothetical protein IGI04_024551 [Brassica rapa subsp. trilocularis]|uniref:Uncharacterized protein n=1 Tax=Brassica rapa subsp. trilocularis TaxID=1813537 RepID=A0ABQ7M927_BRACM|nr:hypothetical protein IGI04_024551 [Brassica rapa subsp. trilocularis]